MDETFKFRIFRNNNCFFLTKQKVATRFLGQLFKNEGHEIIVDVVSLKIEHIDLLGASKKVGEQIEEDWNSIIEGTYNKDVVVLFRDPSKRFVTSQVQDFADVIANFNSDPITEFAFTSYFNRRFNQSTNFLSKFSNCVESGDYDSILLLNDGTYDISAYNLMKDLLYDWITFRFQKGTITELHSENYLYTINHILGNLEKNSSFSILNIDDSASSLKNYCAKWFNIDSASNKMKHEQTNLKKVLSDLVKENIQIQKIMNIVLENERFVFSALKQNKNLIRYNLDN